jgi:hypothetical protein
MEDGVEFGIEGGIGVVGIGGWGGGFVIVVGRDCGVFGGDI